MKRLIWVFSAIFLILPAISVADDAVLTCDPQAGVIKYKLEIEGAVTTESDALENGAADHGIDYVPVGENQGKLYAGAAWTIDGVLQTELVWSDPRPFVLGRPGQLASPTNINLKENH